MYLSPPQLSIFLTICRNYHFFHERSCLSSPCLHLHSSHVERAICCVTRKNCSSQIMKYSVPNPIVILPLSPWTGSIWQRWSFTASFWPVLLTCIHFRWADEQEGTPALQVAAFSKIGQFCMNKTDKRKLYLNVCSSHMKFIGRSGFEYFLNLITFE